MLHLSWINVYVSHVTMDWASQLLNLDLIFPGSNQVCCIPLEMFAGQRNNFYGCFFKTQICFHLYKAGSGCTWLGRTGLLHFWCSMKRKHCMVLPGNKCFCENKKTKPVFILVTDSHTWKINLRNINHFDIHTTFVQKIIISSLSNLGHKQHHGRNHNETPKCSENRLKELFWKMMILRQCQVLVEEFVHFPSTDLFLVVKNTAHWVGPQTSLVWYFLFETHVLFHGGLCSQENCSRSHSCVFLSLFLHSQTIVCCHVLDSVSVILVVCFVFPCLLSTCWWFSVHRPKNRKRAAYESSRSKNRFAKFSPPTFFV